MISMKQDPGKKFYIVIDFEATCWLEEERRGDVEIIEFGCIRVSMSNYRILDEFSSFVRPTRYPILSEHCTRLTGITQQDVSTAPIFPEVNARFTEWLAEPAACTFCSWGAFDQYLLRQACRFHRVPYPFDDEYINIKPAFSEAVSGRGVNMERAMQMLEIPFEGRLHRALDDARNVAKIWQALLKGIV